MALQIHRGETRSFGKLIAASFAVMALAIQPLVALNIPSAFAADVRTLYVKSSGGDNRRTCLDIVNPCRTIAKAVENARPGDTIIVAHGDYLENVRISKAITLKAQSGAVVKGYITIASSNVTVDGFTVRSSSQYGISVSGNISNIIVSNNAIRANATAESAKGIYVGDGNASSVSLLNNTIDNITTTNPEKGAYGILINKKQFTGLKIEGNKIGAGTYRGSWITPIGLEGDTPGAIISGNTVELSNATKALNFEDNPSAKTVNVTDSNKFNGKVFTNNTNRVDVNEDYASLLPYAEVLSDGAYRYIGINAFASTQDAVSAVDTEGVVKLLSDVHPKSSILINKALTFDGNGLSVISDFARGSLSDYSGVIEVQNVKSGVVKFIANSNKNFGVAGQGDINVTVKNSGYKNLHGINVYNSSVELVNLITRNNGKSGLNVGKDSDVTVTNLTTNNNAWHGVDVDKGGKFTVLGQSAHSEQGPDIFIDDYAGGMGVVEGDLDQYEYVDQGISRIYTWKFANPIKDMTPVSGTLTNDVNFPMTWSAVLGAKGYQYRTSNTLVNGQLGGIVYCDGTLKYESPYKSVLAEGCGQALYNERPDNFILNSTVTRGNSNTPDGTYYWQVRAINAYNIVGEWSVIQSVTVDGKNPVVSIVSKKDGIVDGYSSYKVSQYVTVNVDDKHPGTTEVFKLDGTRVQSYDVSDMAGDLTLKSGLAEGMYYITHTDKAGNVSDKVEFAVSRTKAAISNVTGLDEYWSVNKNNILTFDVSKNNASDVDQVSVRVKSYDESKASHWGAKQYFSQVVGTDEGHYEVDLNDLIANLEDGEKYVILIEARNTANTHQQIFTDMAVDNTAPTLTMEYKVNGDGTYTVSGETDADDGTEVVVLIGTIEYRVTVTDGKWSVTTDKIADGPYDVVATISDDAGNTQTTTGNYPFTTPKRPSPEDRVDNVIAAITPAQPAVLGLVGPTATSDEIAANAAPERGVLGAEDVKGAATTKADETAASKSNGFAWYWWLVIAAAVAFTLWLIAAARRRKREQEA